MSTSGGEMSLGMSPAKNLVPPLSPNQASPNQAFLLDEQARIRATVARVAIFRDLSSSVLDDLSRRTTVRRIPGGEPIVTQEQGGDALYVILAGRAKVVLPGESGREV